MKIMTFNTQHCHNYIEKKTDFEVMANAIKALDPDIVGLNEMRGAGDAEGYVDQTGILAELSKMEHTYFAKAIDVYEVSSPYGNGLLSKSRIISAQNIPIPDPTVRNGNRWYESRCILKAKIESGITVMIVHVGLNTEEKESAIKTILENLEDERCVVMGDFNMRPDDNLLLPLRERMVDTAEKFTEPKFSFPSDNPIKKIDYIFVTSDIEIISADIPNIVASDHRPHTAEIEF